MVEVGHPRVSVRRQCELLGLSRSGWYTATGRQIPEQDVALMKAIDRVYTDYPWYGSRRLREALRRQAITVNRKRVQRLMRQMGIQGVLPRRGTSRRAPGHVVYPYLLRGVEVNRADQAWSADITYVPLSRGFMYLVAVMDWYSRYVLAWELSNSLDSSFCVEAARTALAWRRPEIFNTDQGRQFTAQAFIDVLTDAGVRISMDGRGRALDNVFNERLWRSVKYEDIYLRDYETVPDLYRGLIRYFRYYNSQRPHQGLGYRTPVEVYRGSSGNGPSGLVNPEGGRRLQYCQGEPPAEDGPVGPGKAKAITP